MHCTALCTVTVFGVLQGGEALFDLSFARLNYVCGVSFSVALFFSSIFSLLLLLILLQSFYSANPLLLAKMHTKGAHVRFHMHVPVAPGKVLYIQAPPHALRPLTRSIFVHTPFCLFLFHFNNWILVVISLNNKGRVGEKITPYTYASYVFGSASCIGAAELNVSGDNGMIRAGGIEHNNTTQHKCRRAVVIAISVASQLTSEPRA